MFISSASSSSSSSSSTINSLIDKLNQTKIVSCVLAMSKINMNKFSKNFVHASLLLINTNSDVADESRGDGIIIEYGDYSPTMSDDEIKSVEKGRVIYRYGDKGGLRYYAFKYTEFLETFGDICYVSMDIKPEYQVTFQYFLDKVAPESENDWIKEKYNVSILNGIFGSGNHNCQTFAAKALNILKPSFNPHYIIKKDTSKKTNKKIDIFPKYIKDVLETLKY